MIELDDHTRALAERIRTESDHDALMGFIAELDRHIFLTMCAKPYLEEPDPGVTCTFYSSGTCGYVNAIKAIYDGYGINVPEKRR